MAGEVQGPAAESRSGGTPPRTGQGTAPPQAGTSRHPVQPKPIQLNTGGGPTELSEYEKTQDDPWTQAQKSEAARKAARGGAQGPSRRGGKHRA
ncbi:hypothetical protein LTR37_004950 [Vermiconidia calcicola]|uniref:Uncharacterized protein n=1 Tax=Vermiconidia calcicola TaxID=1690605 RepID=A0ACC3NL33_9PEZI|nr:hypothetical protein LTR37_004950 [Vermiconidia calcicola]